MNIEESIEEQDLHTIVNDIWAGLVGLEVQPTFDAPAAGPQAGHTLHSRVQIDGAWQGAVVITCPPALAERAAAAMLGAEPGSPEEVLDIVGELANVTGGNIKALLPGPAKLSLPTVAPGAGHTHDPDSVRVFAFECEGETFTVALVSTVEEDQGANG